MISNLPYPTVARIIKVTDFKDEQTALAAIETLKWLDAGAPHKLDGLDGDFFFDIEKFISTRFDPHGEPCGTSCCIAGAISTIKNHGDIEKRSYATQDDLDREFGTKWYKDTHELSKLFYPGTNGYIENKTPEQAAKALRGYLFTGKTNWNDQ